MLTILANSFATATRRDEKAPSANPLSRVRANGLQLPQRKTR